MSEQSRIIVTGGNGFLGKVVCSLLAEKGQEVITFSSKEYDLTREADVQRLFEDYENIDAVVHLAADVGGIGYNKKYPGTVLYNNLMMNTLLQEYARQAGVKKFVGIGSVCSYPKIVDVPFKEDTLWDGYPEETNASYGLSKKMMMVQSQAYRQEYGFNGIHLLMINLYGPRDNFDLENSHVIPALIRKFVEAKENGDSSVTLWGDGSASREFLYVDDAAQAIVLALESYDSAEPVNIGSGQEITIKELAEIIQALVGFKGSIKWDTTKPNGQPRRCLDTSRAKEGFGFEAEVSFEEGLRKTIDWYLENRHELPGEVVSGQR